MAMRFRCCGNQANAGHADNCSLKPRTKAEEEISEGEGCQFDILNFKHIGECKGTCEGDEEEGLRFADDSGDELLIILVDDLDEEKIKELENRGLRRLTAEDLEKIITLYESGKIKVKVTRMTYEEVAAKYVAPSDEDPDPFLNIREAAEALQFSESWTRALCRQGRLKGVLKIWRRWAIPRSAIYKED